MGTGRFYTFLKTLKLLEGQREPLLISVILLETFYNHEVLKYLKRQTQVLSLNFYFVV